MKWFRVVVRRVRALAGWRAARRSRESLDNPGSPLVFNDRELMGLSNAFLDRNFSAGGAGSAAAFTREDLFYVGTPRADPGFDERRTAALMQASYRQSGVRVQWRKSGHGHFLKLSDGREVMILQRPVLRASAEAALRKLIERGDAVIGGLGSRAHLISPQWPLEVGVEYDGGIHGYVGPSLDPAFVMDSGRSGPAVRTLILALGTSRRRVEHVDGPGRLELVRLVLTWLRAMHSASVVHGSLSLTSVAFATSPLRIAALDYATARVLGHGNWHSLARAEGGSQTPRESSLDEDRRAFAELAFSLLVPQADNMTQWLSVPAAISGLDRGVTGRLQWLWLRASGYKGTMPTLDEWSVALGAVDAQSPSDTSKR